VVQLFLVREFLVVQIFKIWRKFVFLWKLGGSPSLDSAVFVVKIIYLNRFKSSGPPFQNWKRRSARTIWVFSAESSFSFIDQWKGVFLFSIVAI